MDHTQRPCASALGTRPISPGTETEHGVPESAEAVVSYLSRQHREIVGWLDDVVQAPGDQQAVAFLRFRQLLAVHEAC